MKKDDDQLCKLLLDKQKYAVPYLDRPVDLILHLFRMFEAFSLSLFACAFQTQFSKYYIHTVTVLQ